jgi:large subunit ribosomal protein L20
VILDGQWASGLREDDVTRVKGGGNSRRRHKKILKLTKGMYGTRHRLFRRANEAVLKSLSYAYRDRRTRKRDLRRLWIARINAAARQNGITYSRLIHAMKKSDIQLNRKMLADIAVRDPNTFTKVIAAAKN